jgi:hypothetical protein
VPFSPFFSLPYKLDQKHKDLPLSRLLYLLSLDAHVRKTDRSMSPSCVMLQWLSKKKSSLFFDGINRCFISQATYLDVNKGQLMYVTGG